MRTTTLALTALCAAGLTIGCGGIEETLDSAEQGLDQPASTAVAVLSTPSLPEPPVSGTLPVATSYAARDILVSGSQTENSTHKVIFQIRCADGYRLPATVKWSILDGSQTILTGTGGKRISSQVFQVEQSIALSARNHTLCALALDGVYTPSYKDTCASIEVYRRVHFPPDFFDPESGHAGGLMHIEHSQFRFDNLGSRWIPSEEMEALFGMKTTLFPLPPLPVTFGPVSCVVFVNDIRTWDIAIDISGVSLKGSMAFEDKDPELKLSCGFNGVSLGTMVNVDFTDLDVTGQFLLSSLASGGLQVAVTSFDVNLTLDNVPPPAQILEAPWKAFLAFLSQRIAAYLSAQGLVALNQAKAGDMLRDVILSHPLLAGTVVRKVAPASDGGLEIDVQTD